MVQLNQFVQSFFISLLGLPLHALLASYTMEVESDTECVVQNEEGKLVSIRTSALEEQATGAQMIVLLCESLEEHFFPYVQVRHPNKS